MARKTVKEKKIARYVHAGMGDTALMEKYGLTPRQLEKVLRMLLDCDLITQMQLSSTNVPPFPTPQSPRHSWRQNRHSSRSIPHRNHGEWSQ